MTTAAVYTLVTERQLPSSAVQSARCCGQPAWHMPSGMFSRGPYGGGGGRGDGGGVDGTGGDDGGAGGSSRYAPASMKVAEVAVDPQWQSWPSGRNGEPSQPSTDCVFSSLVPGLK